MDFTETKQNKYRYVILLILFLAWTVGYLDRAAINMGVIPIAKEFKLNATQTGLIMSFFYLSYSFMQLIGGVLADKIGSRIVLIVSIAMWSLFTGLTGLATSFAMLIVTRFFFGFGEGSFPSASSVTVADWFQKKERARAKSVVLTGSVLGSLLGTAAAGLMISAYGWRKMFFVLLGLGIIVTIFFIIFMKQPKGLQERKKAIAKKQKAKLTDVLKSPMVICVVIGWFFWNLCSSGMYSWLPSYWVKSRGMSLVQSGFLSALPSLLSVIGMLGSGYLVDKVFVRKEKYFGIIGLVGYAICSIGMFTSRTVPVAVTFSTISGLFSVMMSPVVFSFPLKYVKEIHVGSATGLVNFGGMFSNIFGTSIIGYILTITNNNFNAVMWFLLGCIAISILMMSLIKIDPKEQDEISMTELHE